MIKKKEIFVTRPSLPKYDSFEKLCKQIWKNRRLTNFSNNHNKLEENLKRYLGVQYVSLFCNGTIALELGLEALELKGEVITTPFTFPATIQAIIRSGLKPVFCDINESDFNIDPEKIEQLITHRTSAILAVHIFGNPCDLKKIQQIADKHNLKVIYDAAHAFGEKIGSESLAKFGDLTMFSFHATKIFNTIEGGALTYNDRALNKKLCLLRNFGIESEEEIPITGTNGKMNELQAIVGLLNLEKIEENIKKLKKIYNHYVSILYAIPGITIPKKIADVKYNYSYMAIRVDSEKFEMTRDELYYELKKHKIFARRYFYPLLTNCRFLKGYKNGTNNYLATAEKIAKEILCLPIYVDLDFNSVKKITEIIINNQK